MTTLSANNHCYINQQPISALLIRKPGISAFNQIGIANKDPIRNTSNCISIKYTKVKRIRGWVRANKKVTIALGGGRKEQIYRKNLIKNDKIIIIRNSKASK